MFKWINKHLKYLVLISNMVNIDKDNYISKNSLGPALIFMNVEESWDQKYWESKFIFTKKASLS